MSNAPANRRAADGLPAFAGALFAASAPLLGAAAIVLTFAACGDETTAPANRPPNLRDMIAIPPSVVLRGTTRVTALGSDPDGDAVTTSWTADGGTLSANTGTSVSWTAPDTAGAYSVRATVTDGEESASRSLTILVGEGSITVVSNPPGASVTLDGAAIPVVTPHTFARVAIGDHELALTSIEYRFANAARSVYVGHQSEQTVTFETEPARFEVVDLGRDDFSRIGGVTYLADGSGLLYTGITPEDGPGIYTSSLVPRAGVPNGLLLVADAAVTEPVAIRDDWIVYTGVDGTLFTSRITDAAGDGLVDGVVEGPMELQAAGFGASMAENGRIAFTVQPSEGMENTPVFWTDFSEGTIGFLNVIDTGGRRPAWRPSGSAAAYERAGGIYLRTVNDFSNGPEETLVDPSSGRAMLPAWGGFGPGHVAYAYGSGEDLTEVRLQVRGGQGTVTVFTGLFDPTGLAWNSQQREIAVAHNPGKGQIVLIVDVPVP